MQNYGQLTQDLLKKRNIIDSKDIDIFFNPDYERDMHDPFLMRDMERACVRLYEAIDANQKIVIYADYDCDGIPGAVILSQLFKKINYKNYEVYIPERNSEGYGLNREAIDSFIEKDVKLLVTIDLGITAVDEVAHALVSGIDTIITDHHLPLRSEGIGGLTELSLPRAYAILNPKVDDYPEKMLCGAGVVFKFIQAFVKKYGEYFKINNGWEKWLLDMAGLATLSDMVPLLGENRTIAYFGLKVLKKTPRPGLQKLLGKINIDQRYLTEDDVGFMIAPRLNAASRMDSPMRAFELLSTEDSLEGASLANHLSNINDERKSMVSSIMREVHKTFTARANNDILKEVIVVGNPTWQVGVLGLVASKICDTYDRPVFVWGKDENDFIKGSCRSDGSVSLVELMSESKEHFLEYGGHELAGGFTVHTEKIHFLEESLATSFHKVKRENGAKEKGYDVKLDLKDVNIKTWKEVERFAPFGFDNPKPIFLFEKVKIEKIKKFGKNGSGEHLEIIFSDETKDDVKAIAFFSRLDSFSIPIDGGGKVNLLATFELSRFRGKTELRLRIVDII